MTPVIPVMQPWLDEREAEAASEAVLSGWVAQGPRVAAFETAFAGFIGASHAVAVSSCTTALHLGLLLLGVGPGDDVVVPSLSFIATANAVTYVGGRPVFAEVDGYDGNMTAETVAAALTPATRAVVVVHQGGMPADADAVRALCESRGIAVLEDAACAVGSLTRGRRVGSGSPMAAWSFHPRKLLTTGEGGMITTEDPELADRARRLREHGMNLSAAARHASRQPVIESYLEIGFNFRMTDVQAAIGGVQLTKVEEMVLRRRRIVERYQHALADVPGVRSLRDHRWGRSNFQSFWIELGEDYPMSRNELLAHLAAAGVSARPGIMAAHRQPAYAGHPHGDLRVTDRITDSSLILPVFHALSETEQDVVVDAVRRGAGLRAA
jgi:dTDP-4-amino-4,6-dideoxygalactose transaminase